MDPAPPPFAAFRLKDALDGYEVVFFHPGEHGLRVEGHSVAVEEGAPYAVHYEIALDTRWRTHSARVTGHLGTTVEIEGDGEGRWHVDGRAAPDLDGCLDVDLEASSLTNAFPVNRMQLADGDAADAPAVYVRALDLAVERLEQRYRRLDRYRYDYLSPADGFRCELVYDATGLVLEYPGIATRTHPR